MEKLEDEQIATVTGGYIFNAVNISNSDPQKPWEIIDDKTGDVLGRFANYDDALEAARKVNRSGELISWDDLVDLRKKSGRIK